MGRLNCFLPLASVVVCTVRPSTFRGLVAGLLLALKAAFFDLVV